MARIVCYLDGQYFEFSSVADGPCSGLMSEDEFREHSLHMYGELYILDEGADGFKARIKRAQENGHSRMLPNDHKSLEAFLIANMSEYATYHEETDNFTHEKWPGMEAFKQEWFIEDEGNEPIVQLEDMNRGGN